MSETKSAETLNELSPLQKAALAIKKLKGQIAEAEYAKREPIAIMGMGCRFPAADGLTEYWDLLSQGKDAIREVPKDRWDLSHFYDPNPNAPGKINTRYGGFVENVDAFDAEFFGISPYEAERIDPQQRILLEVAWHALEDAGIPPNELRSSRTGVFVGITQMDYGVMQLGGQLNDIDGYTGTGNGFCFAAGRLSYLLGLHGPAFSVDTACSSSMVALHQASQALRNGECDVALVAGAQLNLTPSMQVFLSKTQSFAPDGRCRTFDEAANGFVLGEGVGVLVLRRLSDAQKDNANIRTVIRGSGVNHDGPASGLTVPNEIAQINLIREVYQRAGLVPDDIDYVEAHGTATELGDPIEVGALRSVFGQRTAKNDLWLGSVKTNFGHLNAAAGIAGLIKVALMLEHEKIAPNLHFKQGSSKIPWDKFSVKVPTELEPWPTQPNEYRKAAISSFGLSGTNTHVVLEEKPHVELKTQNNAEVIERPSHILCLSARNQTSLKQTAQNLLSCKAMSDETPIADICYSANTGRDHFNERLAFIATDKETLRQQLLDFTEAKHANNVATSQIKKGLNSRLAIVITDDIPVNAIYHLAKTQPNLNSSLKRCQHIADQIKPGLLVEGEYSQSSLFSAQFALAEFWLGLGLKPTAISGAGVGELTALYIAGVIDLEQAFKMLAGQAVNTRAASIPVFSAVDGQKQPYSALDNYEFTLSDKSSNNTAVEALEKARFNNLLAIGSNKNNVTTPCIGLFPQDEDLWFALSSSITELHLKGIKIDWRAYDEPYNRNRVRLPGYAFQRQRYWRGPTSQEDANTKSNNQEASITKIQKQVAEPNNLNKTHETNIKAFENAETAKNDLNIKLDVETKTTPLDTQPIPSFESASNTKIVTNNTNNIQQLLEAQLLLASDAINDVVEQQLAFIKQRVKTSPISTSLDPNIDKNPAIETEVTPTKNKPPRYQIGDWFLLLMAAENEQGLTELTNQIVQSLSDETKSIIGCESSIGEGKVRRLLVHQGNEDILSTLDSNGIPDLKRIISAKAQNNRDVIFMFPGVGDHYLNMAQGLYKNETVFRDTVDECCQYLKTHLNVDLLSVIYPAKQEKTNETNGTNEAKMDFRAMLGRGNVAVDPAIEKLNKTLHSQPIVFIIEYALGQLWLSRGVKPSAMIGYSIGEYAAACLSGVINLQDVLKLVTERARMIDSVPAGVMLAVPLSEAQLTPLLNDQLSLSIISTPKLCVIGGTEEAITNLESSLKQDEVVSRRLPGTHAFHSHMLAPLHDSLVDLVKGFNLKAPTIPYISNLTGNWITSEQATDPNYWARHTWQTVRFADGLEKLLTAEGRIFLEVGPGQSLGSFVLQHPAAQKIKDKVVLPSIKNRYEKQSDEAFLLSSLGKLWLSGFTFE
ncbi:type I polyketide synthase [Algibacillus agarilyticus]|uniref:type I polyketide synthase n=1 Tax=Algibacillus agarilyticus TaxID=2234133 RepID=UPI000DD084B2|nr:type I polyketide synthase [Algibacillus agarilyticus]